MPTLFCSTCASGLRDLVRQPLKSNHQTQKPMAIKNWPELTHTAVLQQICCSQAGPCSFLIAKGVLFLTTSLSSVCYVAAEMENQNSGFCFQPCNVFFHPFKVQGAELKFRNFSEITNRSHWAVLCIYFVFFYRERKQTKEFKRSSEKPKRKPQVLFFSSELMFSEASSLSTKDTMLCSSRVFKYHGSPRETLWMQIILMSTERCR